MATHLAAVLTPHGHTLSSCTHHTWPITQQLYSPHMATHLAAVLTTHGHSLSSCTHPTWPLTQQLYSPLLATQSAAVLTTHGHSLSSCTHHTWPFTQQLYWMNGSYFFAICILSPYSSRLYYCTGCCYTGGALQWSFPLWGRGPQRLGWGAE